MKNILALYRTDCKPAFHIIHNKRIYTKNRNHRNNNRSRIDVLGIGNEIRVFGLFRGCYQSIKKLRQRHLLCVRNKNERAAVAVPCAYDHEKYATRYNRKRHGNNDSEKQSNARRPVNHGGFLYFGRNSFKIRLVEQHIENVIYTQKNQAPYAVIEI